MPERVSQTWLHPNPNAYPIGVTLRLAGDVPVDLHWVTGRRETRTPAYLRVCVDRRLVWQVCDRVAWRAIGDALFDAQRCLQQG